MLNPANEEGGGRRRLLYLRPGITTVHGNVIDRLRSLALALFLILFAMPALAGPFEDAVGKFATDDFSDTEEAIAGVASSGNPLAYPIISALADERLMFDAESKKVYIKQADGRAIDAATGAAVDSIPDSASAVNLNNEVIKSNTVDGIPVGVYENGARYSIGLRAKF